MQHPQPDTTGNATLDICLGIASLWYGVFGWLALEGTSSFLSSTVSILGIGVLAFRGYALWDDRRKKRKQDKGL